MIYLFQIALLILAVLVAWYQAWLIDDKDGKILHGLWFAAWAVVTALTLWPMWNGLGWVEIGLYIVAVGCGHMVVFNIALNRFRGLDWNYTSLTTGSKIDQLELALFGQRVWLIDSIVGVFFFTSNFFIWFLSQNSA